MRKMFFCRNIYDIYTRRESDRETDEEIEKKTEVVKR